MAVNIPKKINLGSGKDFREDFLNLDINDYWAADIIVDVSSDFLTSGRNTFNTRRFGTVILSAGTFDEIIANDVLEHVPDLVATMTNCLELLKLGGKFNIIVPYDLSYGAWQDPTHVRAFNERSWLYYTDWFWYVGWKTHRFQVTRLEYILSPRGIELHKAGQPAEALLTTPRLVDSMSLTLEKIEVTANDKQTLQSLQQQHKKIEQLSAGQS